MPRRTRVRIVPRAGLALTVMLGLVVSAAGTATAQETTTTIPTTASPTSTSPPSSTTTPHPDPDAFAALANQVSQNQSLLVELSTQVDQATQRLAELAAAIADTQQKLDAARAEKARLRQIVRTRASYIYTHASSPQVAVADIQHVEDITSGKQYAESATRTDGTRIDQLGRLSAELDAHRRDLEADRVQQQAQKDRLEAAKAGLEAVTARQKKLLDEAGAVPVMGDAELTASDLVDWFRARGARYRLAGGIDIADLVQLYMEEGKAEHVRPELAFAQSIIETGSFGNATDNNFAGIGACDSCQGEPAFPTPRDGVRGQIQLLRNYADPTSRAANLANVPSPTIYGTDPVAAAQSYDTFFAKGTAPTWNAMGNGNWATDPGYAQKVLTVYFQMVSFAAKHA
jgi:Mannosyl-glycoprotein endo-beta-N-acetylglucosaminidase